MKPELHNYLRDKGIELSNDQKEKLDRFRDHIIEMSGSLNLISKGDLGKVELLHFADSLSPVNEIPARAKLADWGSGGGLPGIPLAIARPDLDIVLIESRRNKASFLMRVTRELGLNNVTVYAGRGEDSAEKFDVITVRAVGKICDVVETLSRSLNDDGMIIFYKGEMAEDELKDSREVIDTLGLRKRIEDAVLPEGRASKYIFLKK